MIITRCPGCETLFRVTREQLQMRDGRVRCGQCGHVFNALHTLLEPSTIPAEAALPGYGEGHDQASEGGPAATAGDAARQARDAMAAERARAASLVEVLPIKRVPQVRGAGPRRPKDSARRADAQVIDAEPIREAAQSDAFPDEPAAVDDEALEELNRQRARRTAVLWSIGVALLALLLLVQSVYVFRAELATRVPGVRPHLERLCAALDCTVPLPHRPDLVSIEASELRPDPRQAGRLVLTATVRNRAGFVQDFPHLELTLTDMRDEAVARRVFEPAQYLPAAASAQQGFAASSEVAVHLVLELTGLEATGYRVYLFYP
ncbi:MAG: DUF3426 domain-containing protein [Betaproteobacteria bacterium]|nr:DUF3426 domain-containing protein [Betaproteobacteria bacterium]